MHDEMGPIQFENVLDALRHEQRRRLLFALLDHNPQHETPVVLDDTESDIEVVESVVSMRHVHLPKLVECGFVEWDREQQEVMKGPGFDEIRPLLELLYNHRDELPDPWIPVTGNQIV